MRPTIDEQLHRQCQILETVIGPAIAEPRAQDVLREVLRGLRVLERNWGRIVPFLQWDNDSSLRLLHRGYGLLTASLQSALGTEDATYRAANADFDELNALNERLRSMLAQFVTELDPDASSATMEMHAAISNHLDERARRFPLRSIPDLPRNSGAKEDQC